MSSDEKFHVTWKVKEEAVSNQQGEVDPAKRRQLKTEIEQALENDIESTYGVEEAAEPATTIALCMLALTGVNTVINVLEYLESRDETDSVEVKTANGGYVKVTGSNGETVVEITSPDGETEEVHIDR